MKIDINKVKQIPKYASSDEEFGVCVYGEPSEEVKEWISSNSLPVKNVGPYTNVYIKDGPTELFSFENKTFDYMDGFSPNLNKYLHIGHFSNLVLAKAFLSLGISKKTLAILGDTLKTGDTDKETAYAKYVEYCKMFGYPVNHLFMASEMKLVDESIMKDGEGEYAGTKVFEVDGSFIVGKKSDGNTSYFYQDVALAQELNAPTVYMTGMEQTGHFEMLKKMFPHIHHIGLGLVTIKGGAKMSSRLGNAVMLDDAMKLLKEELGTENTGLCYNVMTGHILKSAPGANKNLELENLKPVNSGGLLLSYTLARMKSAGVNIEHVSKFVDSYLQFKFMKAKANLQPNLLLEGLLDHANKINSLYVTHKIAGNEANKVMFSGLASDMFLGMSKLGMFDVDHV